LPGAINRLLYFIFYILFSKDTWRIAFGLLATAIISPHLISGGDYSIAGQIIIGVMILGLGYAIFAVPARHIADGLKKLFGGK
jgi:hypothetical protein